MNCEQARQYWNDRIDGKIIDEAALDAHVAGCSACRRYGDEMRQLTGLLDALGRDTESIVSGRTNLRPERRSRTARVVAAARPWIAVAAAIVIVAGVWIQRSDNRSGIENGVTSDEFPEVAVTTVEPAPLGLTLRGASATRFMAVREPTKQANVQVFRLYQNLLPADANESS